MNRQMHTADAHGSNDDECDVIPLSLPDDDDSDVTPPLASMNGLIPVSESRAYGRRGRRDLQTDQPDAEDPPSLEELTSLLSAITIDDSGTVDLLAMLSGGEKKPQSSAGLPAARPLPSLHAFDSPEQQREVASRVTTEFPVPAHPPQSSVASPVSHPNGAPVDSIARAACESDGDSDPHSDPHGVSEAEAVRNEKRLSSLRQLQQLIERTEQRLLRDQAPTEDSVPRSVPRLIGQLESTSSSDFKRTIELIAALGDTESPSAIQTIGDYANRRNRRLKKTVAEALAKIKHPASARILLTMLMDAATDVEEAAERALIQHRNEHTVLPLIALAATANHFQSVLLDLLCDSEHDAEWFTKKVGDAFKLESPQLTATALFLLARVSGKAALPKIHHYLGDEDDTVRAAAVRAIGVIDDKQVLRPLGKAIEDPNAEIRAAAAAGLQKFRNPGSIKRLVRALSDDDPRVRRTAAGSLIGADLHDLEDQVIAAVRMETERDTTIGLLKALATSELKAAELAIAGHFEHSDESVRKAAIGSLRRPKVASVIKKLLSLLEDSDPDIRRAAVDSLSRTDHGKVAAAVGKVLKGDSAESVRAAAARALGILQDKKSLQLLEEAYHDEQSVRCQAVIAVGRLQESAAIPGLIAQLRDQSSQVRYHAIQGLATLKATGACDAIRELMDDIDPMVARRAEAALTELGERVTTQKLVRGLRRQLSRVGSMLLPNSLTSLIPGGSIGLLAATLIVLGGLAGVGYYANDVISGPPSVEAVISTPMSLDLSPDGQFVSVVRSFGVIDRYATTDGSRIDRLIRKPHSSLVFYSGSAAEAVLLSASELSVWNPLAPEDPVTPIAGIKGRVVSVSTTPDGSRAVTFGANGEVHIVDLKARNVVVDFQVGKTKATDLTMSPDGSLLAGGNSRGEVTLFSAADGSVILTFSMGDVLGEHTTINITALAISPDSTKLAVAVGTGVVAILKTENLKPVQLLFAEDTAKSAVYRMSFLPDGERLVTGDRLGRIRFSAVETGDTTEVAGFGCRGVDMLAVSRDGRQVAVGGAEDRDAWIVDVQSATVKHRLRADDID